MKSYIPFPLQLFLQSLAANQEADYCRRNLAIGLKRLNEMEQKQK
jgi:hypothetical protein